MTSEVEDGGAQLDPPTWPKGIWSEQLKGLIELN